MKKLILLILILLSGCAATGPVFKPVENVSPNDALLYIYRENTFPHSARAAYFYINDTNVFDLNTQGYSWLTLPPGKYRLKQKWGIDVIAKPIETEVELKAGQIRYMQFRTSSGSCGGGSIQGCIHWFLQEVSPTVGSSSISDKKFQENFGMTKLKNELISK